MASGNFAISGQAERTLLALAAPYRFQLLLLGLLALGSSLFTLAVPWLAGAMIGMIVSRTADSTDFLVILLLAALILIALFNIAIAFISGKTSARLLADLRQRIYAHLQALPLTFHENHRQGDTLALMTFEVARLSDFLTSTLVSVPARLLTALGAAILMFRIDPRLALLVPLMIPAFYLILKLVGRRLRGLAQAIQQAEAEVVAIAEENLEMLPAIKAFAREEPEARRYGAQVSRSMELRFRENRINAALEPIIGLVAAVAAILLLFLAGQNVRSGGMTPSELFSLLFYAALLTRPVAALARTYGQFQTARGTLTRLQTVLVQEAEPGYASPGKLDDVRGGIAFSDVRFAYPGREPTLRGVDFEISPGEIVALTGRNGAGKTTLVKLLLRYCAPSGGHIRIDGRDIAAINLADLRRQIGLVSQRVYLFNGAIGANIAYGRDGASHEEVVEAARLALASDFISLLPQGFETEIGDHGIRLSGGQRQRIALARALIKDPPILILDEATAMYDLEGESALVELFGTALKGRTVIMISHRPAILALATRILRVENGMVRAETRRPPTSLQLATSRASP